MLTLFSFFFFCFIWFQLFYLFYHIYFLSLGVWHPKLGDQPQLWPVLPPASSAQDNLLLFGSLLHVLLYESTLLSFSFFIYFLFFFFFSFLFSDLLVSLKFQFYLLFVLTFFFPHEVFPLVTFSPFRLMYHHNFFLISINFSFTQSSFNINFHLIL